MKSLFITLLILGGAFLAYDGYLAPPSQRLVFPRPPGSEVTEQPQPATPPTEDSAPATPKPVSPPKKDKAPGAATPPPGQVANAPAPSASAPSTAATPPAPKAGEFVPPRFESIEELTGNWLKLPKSAFGRVVKISKPVSLKTSFGESKVPAGQSVVTLGMENGLLVVAPTADSPARGLVGIDDTDFKAQLVETYEDWKVDRVAILKQLFERKKRLTPAPVTASLDRTQVEDDGKPLRSSDGTYPILIAKMHSGDPVEITPQNIIHWGSPEQATVNGLPGWTIDVSYSAKTLFGIQTVDTVAQIQNGKVVAWVYKGSGEPVP